MSELTLDEILADPIVHLVMARDGVAEIDVRALIGRALLRPSVLRNTTDPDASAPCAWKTDFAISRPMVVTTPTGASLE